MIRKKKLYRRVNKLTPRKFKKNLHQFPLFRILNKMFPPHKELKITKKNKIIGEYAIYQEFHLI